MKKSGFRMLLLIALLFSLSVAAYSESLYNGSYDLTIIENKIDFQEEVIIQADNEMMTDILSVNSIQQENGVNISLDMDNNNYSFININYNKGAPNIGSFFIDI